MTPFKQEEPAIRTTTRLSTSGQLPRSAGGWEERKETTEQGQLVQVWLLKGDRPESSQSFRNKRRGDLDAFTNSVLKKLLLSLMSTCHRKRFIFINYYDLTACCIFSFQRQRVDSIIRRLSQAAGCQDWPQKQAARLQLRLNAEGRALRWQKKKKKTLQPVSSFNSVSSFPVPGMFLVWKHWKDQLN